VSEFQYYEFRAIDRPLTDKERAELRALSTRAEITAHSFTNEYHWGDFKGDPVKLMEKYFDAFFYVANWGTRQLMLRLPKTLVDADAFQPYFVGDCFDLTLHKESVVIEWRGEEEGPDYDENWDNGEGGLERLLPIREELLSGDLRALYIGFLGSVQQAGGSYADEIDPDTPEPPLPPGMSKPTPAQKDLADFLRLDPALLEVAVRGAPEGGPPPGPTDEEMAAWLARLPASEKDSVLLDLLAGLGAEAGRRLQGRFRQAWRAGRQAAPAAGPRRTVGQLLEAREGMARELERRAAEKREQERRRREQERDSARRKHLDSLQGRETELWRQVETLIATKQPARYDQAVELLKDLLALAQRDGTTDRLSEQLRQLRQQHAAKRTLIERLDRAGLPG